MDEPGHERGDAQSREQRERELDAVMFVKLQFRQQVGAGNAQEAAQQPSHRPVNGVNFTHRVGQQTQE